MFANVLSLTRQIRYSRVNERWHIGDENAEAALDNLRYPLPKRALR